MNIGRFWTRLLSTLLMFTSICITYAVGRRTKDAVISIYVGVEAINVIKLFFILPVTLLVMLAYQRLTLNADDKYRDRLRYIMNLPFLCYFIIYGLIEYTNHHYLLEQYSPDLSFLIKLVPTFLKGFTTQLVNVFKHIYDVIFYVAVELYGTLILSFSFWQYVNSYTSKSDAVILYPYYTGSSSASMILAGALGYLINLIVSNKYILDRVNIFGANYDAMFHSINILIMIIAVSISLIGYTISLKEHINDYEGSSEQIKDNKAKKTMSFSDALNKIKSSKIVLFMGGCVICYMICINLIEVSWKKQVYNYYRKYASNPSGMSNLYSTVQIAVGVLSIISSIIIRGLLRYSWLITALVTPIMVGVLGVIFLISSMVIPGLPNAATSSILGLDYLFIPVLLGSIQNAFAKSSKYTFFDVTKETALLYVPKQIRDGSKGAVDMIGGRLGKSTGSLIQLTLLSVFVSPQNMAIGQELITPYVTIAVCILAGGWLVSTIMSNIAMKDMLDRDQEQDQEQKINNK